MRKDIVKAAKIVWDFLNLKQKPQAADIIFVLGGSSLYPIKHAAKLYQKGLAKYIFFYSTGGTFTNPRWQEGEVKAYYKTLRKLGIPKKAIIWGEQTDNTLAEAKYLQKFARQKRIKVKKVILVSRPVHQRRAWATFQKQNPDLTFINFPAPEPFKLSSKLLDRLQGELNRLGAYSKKGDLCHQPIPLAVKKAASYLKSDSRRHI